MVAKKENGKKQKQGGNGDEETIARLEVKPFPPALLERIKGFASLIGMERNEFVITFLRQEMKRLRPIQKELKAWWSERTLQYPPDEDDDE
jgi:hypothetical protein